MNNQPESQETDELESEQIINKKMTIGEFVSLLSRTPIVILWTVGGVIFTLLAGTFSVGYWSALNQLGLDLVRPKPLNFIETAPDDLEQQIEESTQVWIVAQRGHHLLNNYAQNFQELLEKNNTSIYIVLTDPQQTNLLKYIGEQSNTKASGQEVKRDLDVTFQKISEIKSSIRPNTGSTINVRVIDAVIPFSGIFCDPEQKRYGYVLVYRFQQKLQRIGLNDTSTKSWQFFFPQVEKMWQSGKNYQISSTP